MGPARPTMCSTESKLKDTQAKILEKCPKVEVEYVSIDYSNFDAKAQEKVSSLSSLSVAQFVQPRCH